MKRKLWLVTIAIILVFLIAIGLIVFSGHNPLNPASHPPKIRAEITAFTVDYGYGWPIAGMTVDSYLYVTVANLGKEKISGLNITIEAYGNESYQRYSTSFYNMNSTFALDKEENKTIKVYLSTGFGSYESESIGHQDFIVTLTSNGTVIDERSLLYPSATSNPSISGTNTQVKDNQNLVLLAVIITALVSALVTLVLLYRRKISQRSYSKK
jgi:hypothetical protein